MIIGRDINPKKQIYYLSALILNEIKTTEEDDFDFFDIYHRIRSKEGISINLYSLSLDWLFLLGAIKKDKNRLIKCF